ncbi:type II toxin-antitoxin system RelE/ParE family toxin [Myxococcota bacterium]|nr:type II toxin-antitoxin system RelE/ParE family toxin [Myxococcota bacterium]
MDLVEILDNIAEDSPVAAKSVLRNIVECANQLSDTPEKYRIVPELLDQGIATYREIIVSPWRIIYKVDRRSVVVLTAIDGRRNVEDILLHRLTTRTLR